MTRLARRKRSIVLGLVAALAVAGAAFAYWTTTGSGTGTAATGTSQAVTITQTATVTGLFPGGPAKGLDFSINNPSAGPQYVNTVTATVTGTDKTGCDATDFTVTQATTPVAQDLPAGSTAFSGAKAPTIKMVNKSSNQDACKSATINISYTSN